MVAFAPDNSSLTYLYSADSLSRHLCKFDLATRREEVLVRAGVQPGDERALSMAERLRRERSRELGHGITRYEWVKGTMQLLLPLPGGPAIFSLVDSSLRTLARASYERPVLDPQVSPDGAHVSYVQGDELFVVGVARAPGGGLQAPRQLTRGAVPGRVSHGAAEFIAQEEMGRRSGVAWSLDGQRLAYTIVDTTDVEMFQIIHQGTEGMQPSINAAAGAASGAGIERAPQEHLAENHAYPFAGRPNARVRLAVVAIAGSEPVLMDLDCGGGGSGVGHADEEYLARFVWTAGGALIAQVLNRSQTHLKLLCFDPATGARTVVLEERSDTWVNLDHFFTPLHRAYGAPRAPHSEASDTGASIASGFIWGSERTGFKHLYQYAPGGRLIAPLTGGEYVVESVVGVDEERGLVYFMAAHPTPLEMHLFVTTLWELSPAGTPRPVHAGAFPRQITRRTGRHAAVLDHALRSYVDVYDSLERVPSVSLHALGDPSTDSLTIFEPPMAVERISRLRLRAPAIVQLRAPTDSITGNDAEQTAAGETLYAAVYRPDPERFGPGPYPTVVAVYGGPNVQHVTDSWSMTVDMRAQFLCSRGVLVLKVDNRGSARRGAAFEGCVRHRLGTVEVADQVMLVRWAVGQGLADPARVGIYGWSYGGYLAALCLCKAPGVFKAAVAGAPVTDWEGYDTMYSERYMGLPASNREGYAASSVMHHCANLTRQQRLLIVHGLLDENVHARHTFRLVNHANELGLSGSIELLLFPDERHMMKGLEARLKLETELTRFLEAELAADPAPADDDEPMAE